MECEFCKKILSTVYSLKTHQKTVKSCLQIQGKTNNHFKCEFCLKIYTTKDSLLSHHKSCKEKKLLVEKKEKIKHQDELENIKNENVILKKQIDLLKENHLIEIEKYKNKIEKYKNEIKNNKKELEIDKLKEELYDVKGQLKVLESNKNIIYDIAKQPKITNTNNKFLSIQSHLDFNNTEQVKRIIDEKYDKKYLFQGQKGVAQFAVDYILKDDSGQLKYICTDPSRQIFKYKDSEGCIKKDVEAKKLTGFLVNSGIQEKTHDVAIDFWTDENGDINGEKCSALLEPAQSIKNIEIDNSIFKKELVNMTIS
jgi:hypothetical protein